MIDHFSLGVRDLNRSGAFYDAVLAPLGYVRLASWGAVPAHPHRSLAFGPPGADAEGSQGEAPFNVEERPDATPAGAGFHMCFRAPDRAAVRAFHAAGLAQGGTDMGTPGLREHYGPNYYAAFLLDPEGWWIEAVTYSAN
jgi:catechol 2,3-dioxygenase-like lactoylglutathione lyase family enzyme